MTQYGDITALNNARCWLVGCSADLRFARRRHQRKYPTSQILSFEKKYDPVPVLQWMQDHPMVPVAGCLLYGIFIVGGQFYFDSRPRLNWRYTMACWNLLLSTFSFIGMMRTLPHLIHNLSTMSLRDNLCHDPRSTYGSGSTGLWVQLFILSKFP